MSNEFSSSPELTNVTFSGNTATSGGGMSNQSSSSPTLTNVTFSGNTASSSSSFSADGGGMYNDGSSSPTLRNVTFSGNTASSSFLSADGGGMYNRDSNPKLTNVTFSGNTASSDGGGMSNIGSSFPKLENVTFSGNTASTNGGGMYNYGYPTLTNVTFSGNTASSSSFFAYGGGMYNNSSSPTLRNVTFSGNTATTSGGGMYNASSYSRPTLTNVTMSGNKSRRTAGTIYGGTVTIQNSIIIGNNGEPALASGTTSKIENSLVDVDDNGTTVGKLHTTGNSISSETYQSEDVFIDASKQDYRLRANSIAIDAGDDSKNTTTTDLAGNPRKQGTIDLGAYEAFPYDVTYEANGATGNVPVDPFTYAIGDTVTVKGIDSSFEKSGHTFAGWNTAADGSGTPYNAGDPFQMGTASVTLYAQWTVNSYTVSFDSQNGLAVADQTVQYNATVTVPAAPTKSGYTFKNWNTAADGSGTVYNVGDTFQMGTANVTLYAQWTVNNYTVSFDTQGGSAVADQAVQYNATVTVPAAPTKAGYTFKNWNTAADGSGTAYKCRRHIPNGVSQCHTLCPVGRE